MTRRFKAQEPAMVQLELTAAEEVDAAFERKQAVKKTKKPNITPGRLTKLGVEAMEAFRAGDCSQLKPSHFVGVYCWLHEKVYGVSVIDEVKGEVAVCCAGLAKRLIEKQFGGDPERMADFFRWAWARERQRENKRRADGLEGSRITWRTMFAAQYMLNDYRVHCSRTAR